MIQQVYGFDTLKLPVAVDYVKHSKIPRISNSNYKMVIAEAIMIDFLKAKKMCRIYRNDMTLNQIQSLIDFFLSLRNQNISN